ncbi:MAG: hypothetical protein OXF42_04515 [Candidatus Dadabacteria bacterium]|nr:hypothetical protein [Candidatus Dadabacteria bacterium]
MSADTAEEKKPLRVRVFIDFWNFSLSLKDKNQDFKTDWHLVGRVLADEAGQIIDAGLPVSFEAMHVYGSYDPASKKRAQS